MNVLVGWIVAVVMSLASKFIDPYVLLPDMLKVSWADVEILLCKCPAMWLVFNGVATFIVGETEGETLVGMEFIAAEVFNFGVFSTTDAEDCILLVAVEWIFPISERTIEEEGGIILLSIGLTEEEDKVWTLEDCGWKIFVDSGNAVDTEADVCSCAFIVRELCIRLETGIDEMLVADVDGLIKIIVGDDICSRDLVDGGLWRRSEAFEDIVFVGDSGFWSEISAVAKTVELKVIPFVAVLPFGSEWIFVSVDWRLVRIVVLGLACFILIKEDCVVWVSGMLSAVWESRLLTIEDLLVCNDRVSIFWCSEDFVIRSWRLGLLVGLFIFSCEEYSFIFDVGTTLVVVFTIFSIVLVVSTPGASDDTAECSVVDWRLWVSWAFRLDDVFCSGLGACFCVEIVEVSCSFFLEKVSVFVVPTSRYITAIISFYTKNWSLLRPLNMQLIGYTLSWSEAGYLSSLIDQGRYFNS